MRLSNSIPGHEPKRNAYVHQKKLYKNVQSSIIYESLRLETTQMFSNNSMDFNNMAHSHNEVLHSNKNE